MAQYSTRQFHDHSAQCDACSDWQRLNDDAYGRQWKEQRLSVDALEREKDMLALRGFLFLI